MGEHRHERALVDTSVVIDLDRLDLDDLPRDLAIATVTLAELAAGPAAASDPVERARRQDRLQLAEASFDPLPFDVAAARAYGRVSASVTVAGRRPRGARALNLLIAATAISRSLPLYTRNADDFAHIDELALVSV